METVSKTTTCNRCAQNARNVTRRNEVRHRLAAGVDARECQKFGCCCLLAIDLAIKCVRASELGVSGMLRCWGRAVTVRTNSCQKCYQIICNLQKLIFQNASRLQVHRCVKRTLTIRSVRKWHMCSSGFVIRARRKRCQKFKCANALTRNGGVGVEEIPPSNPSGGAMYIATKYDPKTTLE